MFRSLLRQNPFLKANRYSELRKYLCLRESMNAEVSKNLANEFNALKTKYSLTSQQLMDIISLLRLDLSLIPKYFPNTLVSEINGELESQYARSSFFSSADSIQRKVFRLKYQYPEVSKYLQSNPERDVALKEIESLVFGAQSISNYALIENLTPSLLLKDSESNTRHLLSNLKTKVNDQKFLKELENTICSILVKIHNNPEYELRKLAMYLDSSLHKDSLAEIKSVETPQLTNSSTYQSLVFELENKLSEKDRNELREIEDSDYAKHLELDTPATTLGRWLDNQKLIFDNSANSYKISPLWLGLLGASSLTLLYFLIYGDAKYSSYGLALALGGASYLRLNRAGIRSSANVVKKIWVNGDGKTADFLFSNGKVSKNVELNSVQILKADSSPVDASKIFESKLQAQTLGDIRSKLHFREAYVLRIPDTEALLPIQQNIDFATFSKLLSGRILA